MNTRVAVHGSPGVIGAGNTGNGLLSARQHTPQTLF